MSQSLLDLLNKTQLTLAVAESLTGGNVQALITQEPGISKWFEGGITAYSVLQKIRHLNVEPEIAKQHLGVHAQTAKDMAIGVSYMFGTDIGIATTGFIEPYPAQAIKEPNAFITIVIKDKVVQEGHYTFPITAREELQKIIANLAIDLLKTALMQYEKN